MAQQEALMEERKLQMIESEMEWLQQARRRRRPRPGPTVGGQRWGRGWGHGRGQRLGVEAQ
eukprot:2027963-Prymnesium_polylepis.1